MGVGEGGQDLYKITPLVDSQLVNNRPRNQFMRRFKQQTHRAWAYFSAQLSFAMAAFNLLVQWHGMQPDENGFVPLAIAEFGL